LFKSIDERMEKDKTMPGNGMRHICHVVCFMTIGSSSYWQGSCGTFSNNRRMAHRRADLGSLSRCLIIPRPHVSINPQNCRQGFGIGMVAYVAIAPLRGRRIVMTVITSPDSHRHVQPQQKCNK
jgi:hypothetical protein